MASVRIDCWCWAESAGNVRVVTRSGAWDVVRSIGRRRAGADADRGVGRLVAIIRR